MELFLDTANEEQIVQAARLGVISGITTNPVIIAKEHTKDLKGKITQLRPITPGTIITEVIARDTDTMVAEAMAIHGWCDDIAVKIPMTLDGLAAVHVLKKHNIPTVVTIVFSVTQALLAAKAGAAYVAPFIGRSCNICQDGYKLVADIAEIFSIHSMGTKIIAASIENPLDVVRAAKCGAHIITVPYSTLMDMANHPSTDLTLNEFLTGWEGISIR